MLRHNLRRALHCKTENGLIGSGFATVDAESGVRRVALKSDLSHALVHMSVARVPHKLEAQQPGGCSKYYALGTQGIHPPLSERLMPHR